MAPPFIQTDGRRFTLAGSPFFAVGVNCYFLAYCSDPVRRSVLTTARNRDATVVRAWAFLDGGPGPVHFQRLEGDRIVANDGPDGLERLDSLIATAEEFDLRLILPFVNHWKDFGGAPQYLSWLDIPGTVDRFYADPRARSAYKQWAETLLTRRNTRTGRLYADEPAVMAWELANEPRCEIPGGRELLLDWIGEMSAFVKSLDRNHLLAAGDEGYFRRAWRRHPLYNGSFGVDADAILRLPTIDFGTFHWYPAAMRKPPEFAATWIRDHVRTGLRANKPMLLAEYGLDEDADRREWYPEWRASARDCGGALVWMLGCADPEVAGFRDTFTVYA